MPAVLWILVWGLGRHGVWDGCLRLGGLGLWGSGLWEFGAAASNVPCPTVEDWSIKHHPPSQGENILFRPEPFNPHLGSDHGPSHHALFRPRPVKSHEQASSKYVTVPNHDQRNHCGFALRMPNTFGAVEHEMSCGVRCATAFEQIRVRCIEPSTGYSQCSWLADRIFFRPRARQACTRFSVCDAQLALPFALVGYHALNPHFAANSHRPDSPTPPPPPHALTPPLTLSEKRQ